MSCSQLEVKVNHAPIVSHTSPLVSCAKCGAQSIYLEQQVDWEGDCTKGWAVHCQTCGCTMYFQPGLQKRKYGPREDGAKKQRRKPRPLGGTYEEQ